MLDTIFLWGAFVGLLAIINPLSTAIVFLGITSKDSIKKKKITAKKAAITSALILIFFILTGNFIFSLFDRTIEAFKIAGGLIISLVGFRMLYPKPKLLEDEQKESKEKEDVSIIPLAIPMLSGPGAITTVLIWTSKVNGLENWIGLLFIPILISVVAYFTLINATNIKKIFGKTGINVIEKLLGLIVLVMGVQFIINALTVLLPKMS